MVALQPTHRAEQANGHIARIVATANVIQRANDVAGFESSNRKDAAVRRTALTEVAQVIREHVVAGIVQDLVIRYEVDFEIVAGRAAERFPRLKM